MAIKFILVILSCVLNFAIDNSLLDAYSPKPTDKLQTIQNLLNISLATFYDLPISEPNVTVQPIIVSQNCTSSFDKFTETVVSYTHCTVEFARPIHICLKCASDYQALEISFEDLKKQGAECQVFFFSSDQLGIVDIIYSAAKILWKKSVCQGCYDNYNNETMNFFEISRDLMTCIENTNKSYINPNSTCEECHVIYANLSESYNKFVQWEKGLGGICMDIVDTMNISRIMWNEYNCNIEFDTSIGFLNVLTALTVALTPAMFYVLAKNISRLEDVKIVRPKRKFASVPLSDQER